LFVLLQKGGGEEKWGPRVLKTRNFARPNPKLPHRLEKKKKKKKGGEGGREGEKAKTEKPIDIEFGICFPGPFECKKKKREKKKRPRKMGTANFFSTGFFR